MLYLAGRRQTSGLFQRVDYSNVIENTIREEGSWESGKWMATIRRCVHSCAPAQHSGVPNEHVDVDDVVEA